VTLLTPSRCPTCNRLSDAATGINTEATPKPGDLAVCFHCGEYLVYGPNLEVKLPTEAELGSLPAETLRQMAILRRTIYAINPMAKQVYEGMVKG